MTKPTKDIFEILINASGDDWQIYDCENINKSLAADVAEAVNKKRPFYGDTFDDYVGEDVVLTGTYGSSIINLESKAIYQKQDAFCMYTEGLQENYSEPESENITNTIYEIIVNREQEMQQGKRCIVLEDMDLNITRSTLERTNVGFSPTVNVYFSIMDWSMEIEIEDYIQYAEEPTIEKIKLNKRVLKNKINL